MACTLLRKDAWLCHRQLFPWTFLLLLCFFRQSETPAKRLGFFHCGAGASSTACTRPTCPVSYTHLDVYKRQGLFAAGDMTGKPLQVANAVGDGLVAALAAVDYLDGVSPMTD